MTSTSIGASTGWDEANKDVRVEDVGSREGPGGFGTLGCGEEGFLWKKRVNAASLSLEVELVSFFSFFWCSLLLSCCAKFRSPPKPTFTILLHMSHWRTA